MADVSQSELREISDLLITCFESIAEKFVPTLLHSHLKDFRQQLDREIRKVLQKIHEGPGEIVVLKVLGSQSHVGVVKITSVVAKKGARKQRISRLKGEIPGSSVECLYSRNVQRRLLAEKTIHNQLFDAGIEEDGISYFRTNLETGIQFIERYRD